MADDMLPGYMEDAFYKRFPRAISHWRPGTTALILEPVIWLEDGELLMLVRFAIRKGRPYPKMVASAKNRLVQRKCNFTLYTVDRYEYAVVYWESTNVAPQIVERCDKQADAIKAQRREWRAYHDGRTV